ncbi:MAG: AAA family ATPase [Candidatus Omnitrophica bacterium]|nr:AAA family ATPase [Candidatus Omnitrophota bacterium]
MNLYAEKNYKPEKTKFPPMFLLYGETGIGKSTFASTFKDPFFFDFEARTAHIKNIKRDRDYGLSVEKNPSFNEFLTAIRELKDTSFQTIVFDGIKRLQAYIWSTVEGHALQQSKSSKDLKSSFVQMRLYTDVYRLFSQVLNEAKLLQRQYEKTVVFIDHEKCSDDGGFKRYQPECLTGVLKIFSKETDYIFRLIEEIAEEGKSKKRVFRGLKILTDRKIHLDSVLKSSMPLPSSIPATASAFGKAYKLALEG